MPFRNLMPYIRSADRDPDETRRISNRINTQGLLCPKGRVLDISATGARIETRKNWKEGKSHVLTFVGKDTTLNITARCVWRRKESMFKWIVGLSFEDLSDEQSRALAEIARTYLLDTLVNSEFAEATKRAA